MAGLMEARFLPRPPTSHWVMEVLHGRRSQVCIDSAPSSVQTVRPNVARLPPIRNLLISL